MAETATMSPPLLTATRASTVVAMRLATSDMEKKAMRSKALNAEPTRLVTSSRSRATATRASVA
jgi:hypothetical protein